MKIITALDVCIGEYNGYWKNGVYYAGIGDIDKVINPFDYKVNDVVWKDRENKKEEVGDNKRVKEEDKGRE